MGSTTYPTYTTSEDVLFNLGMDDFGSSILTEQKINKTIVKMEDRFNSKTNNSFKPVRITSERYTLDQLRYGPLGRRLITYKLELNRFPIRPFVKDTHELKILYADGYYDLLDSANNCTEGWREDFWVNYMYGWIYFIHKFPHYRVQGVETTYDWGNTAVPADVSDAVALMTALRCLQGPSRVSVEISEGGGSIPDQSIIEDWKEQIEDTIGRYHIIPSK